MVNQRVMVTVLFFLAFIAVAQSLPFIVLHGIGDQCKNGGIKNFVKLLSDWSGSQGYCLEIGNGMWTSWTKPLLKQTAIACEKVKKMSDLTQGYNIVGLSQVFAIMDTGRRYTKKYKFRFPDLKKLKEVASFVVDHAKFRHRYGRLLTILNTKIEDGLLNTLVQFYDPVYRCFTFPDYQLLPTLEEYAFLVGIPVSDKVPFSGFEEIPKSQVIAALIHSKKSDVDANLIEKSGIRGMTADFLINKASYFAEMGSMEAFEAILTLLIYGLVLFPNVDNFVDVNAIRIFIIGNPAPTLLGDTYFSIHQKTSVGNETIVYCAPLLYRWFISHLPQSHIFKENKERLNWSRRIMSLTQADLTWYNSVYDTGVIIDSCGEFSNVPLIGIQGGINYNPTLARRQFGFAMADKPKNIWLEGLFYEEGKDVQGLKKRMAHAWHNVHRKDKGLLGKKNCVALKPYTSWVKERAKEFKMPYPFEKPMFPVMPKPHTVPVENVEGNQEALERMRLERDAWKDKYNIVNAEKKKLMNQLKEKEDLLYQQDGWLIEKNDQLRLKDAVIKQYVVESQKERKGRKHSDAPPTSVAWETIVDKLVVENSQLKSFHESQIMKLKRKYQHLVGPSSDGTNGI